MSQFLVSDLRPGDDFAGSTIVAMHAVPVSLFGFPRVALELADKRVVVRPLSSLASAS